MRASKLHFDFSIQDYIMNVVAWPSGNTKGISDLLSRSASVTAGDQQIFVYKTLYEFLPWNRFMLLPRYFCHSTLWLREEKIKINSAEYIAYFLYRISEELKPLLSDASSLRLGGAGEPWQEGLAHRRRFSHHFAVPSSLGSRTDAKNRTFCLSKFQHLKRESCAIGHSIIHL